MINPNRCRLVLVNGLFTGSNGPQVTGNVSPLSRLRGLHPLARSVNVTAERG